jgi:aminopeptidase N
VGGAATAVIAFQSAGSLVAASILAAQTAATAPPAATPAFDITAFELTLWPDPSAGTIAGEERITFTVDDGSARTIEFDAGALVIEAVMAEAAERVPFEKVGARLRVQLPAVPSAAPISRTLTVLYRGAPRRGLQFVADPPQAYTSFSTSQWMVCLDAPSDRATLRLRLVVPETWKSVVSGTFVERIAPLSQRPGYVRDEWFESRPMPSYVFGFATGRFNEARDSQTGVEIRALSAVLGTEELAGLNQGITDMREFFEARAGLRYEPAVYTQVFAGSGVGQEMNGFALLPLSFARARLAGDPVSLDVHELAHQWWGNLITNVDWRHFWLNEGLTTFMVAAYLESRDGRDVYLQVVDTWRARLEALRAANHDRPLQFAEWIRPTADDRAVVYQKGAYAIHLLREQLGERVFWDGVRRFSARIGQSVASADFQADFEAASGRDLSAFFNEWVYGR